MTAEKKPLELAPIKARANAASHGQWMLCEKCHRRVGPGARTDMVGDGRASDCQCDDPSLGTIPAPTLSEIWLLIPWDGLPCRTIEKGGTGSSTPYGVRVFGTEEEGMRYSNGSPQWMISGPFAHAREDVPALIAEVESLRTERDALRKAVIASGREAGAFLADTVSSGFLACVPGEVRLVIADLRADYAAVAKAAGAMHDQSMGPSLPGSRLEVVAAIEALRAESSDTSRARIQCGACGYVRVRQPTHATDGECLQCEREALLRSTVPVEKYTAAFNAAKDFERERDALEVRKAELLIMIMNSNEDGAKLSIENKGLRAERDKAQSVAAIMTLCLDQQTVDDSEHKDACDEYIAAHYASLEGLKERDELRNRNARLEKVVDAARGYVAAMYDVNKRAGAAGDMQIFLRVEDALAELDAVKP